MSELFPPISPDRPIRVAMVVEYDGAEYYGWQMQKTGVPTVQGELTRAISAVANHPVDLIVAGRTDAGVHACRQIIHFDTDAKRKEFGWTVGTNTHLPRNISVQWAKEMDHYFHARFSARERRYRYVIYNNQIPPGISRKNLTWEKRALDAQAMHRAAQSLVGTHDFSSFRAANCQAASPVKTLKQIDVSRHGQLVVIDVRADGFLYHMVRNIAGVLIEIGCGAEAENWCAHILSLQDRSLGGVTARPEGLYFVDAIYDDDVALPETQLGPNFLSWL